MYWCFTCLHVSKLHCLFSAVMHREHRCRRPAQACTLVLACVLICCIWLCLLCLSLPLLWPAACFLESLPSLCVLVYIHHPPAHSLHFHSLTHKMHLLIWAYVWELVPQSLGIVLVMTLMIAPLVDLTVSLVTSRNTTDLRVLAETTF